MTYNPEIIQGKRPQGGEIWVRRDDSSIWVKIIARRTTSTLLALGRRERLADCEDRASYVGYFGKEAGALNESVFVKAYRYYGKTKILVREDPDQYGESS